MHSKGNGRTVLVADIGGTKARFATFAMNESECPTMLDSCEASTASYSGLDQLTDHAMKTLCPENLEAVVYAAAGFKATPHTCTGKNIAWDVDIRTVTLPIKKLLINDFVAQAACLCIVGCIDHSTVRPGRKNSMPVAMVGAGTGLGKCAIAMQPAEGAHSLRPFFMPSEGSWADFPFRGAKENAFASYLESRGIPPYTDNVVSGPGLQRLHAFYTGKECTREIGYAELAASGAFDTFARFYARVCKNFMLDTLAFGGLYLTGGVIKNIPQLAESTAFATELCTCGLLSAHFENTPVAIVHAPDSGLYGAFAYYLLLGRFEEGV